MCTNSSRILYSRVPTVRHAHRSWVPLWNFARDTSRNKCQRNSLAHDQTKQQMLVRQITTVILTRHWPGSNLWDTVIAILSTVNASNPCLSCLLEERRLGKKLAAKYHTVAPLDSESPDNPSRNSLRHSTNKSIKQFPFYGHVQLANNMLIVRITQQYKEIGKQGMISGVACGRLQETVQAN